MQRLRNLNSFCWYVIETSGQGGVYLLDPPPKMWSYLPDFQLEIEQCKILHAVANFLSYLDYELKYGESSQHFRRSKNDLV